MSKRKKLFIISIAVLLAIAIVIGVLCSIYGVAFLRIKSVGVALKPTKTIEPFAVTYYLQNDPQWSSDKLGTSNSTMGKAGCLVASIATAMDYYGVKYDPQELNDIFTENDIFNENGQVIWMNIKNAVPSIDYQYDRVFSANTIENLLDEGLLPIIEVKYKGFGIKHWVVVIGSDGTDFLVMDPLNQSKAPTKLSEHGGRAFAYRVLVKTLSDADDNPTLPEGNGQDIPFQVFYRGFTPVTSDEGPQDFVQMIGFHIIWTDDDWHDFMDKYCPGIPYFISVDYSRECLIASIEISARPSLCRSSEIRSIRIKNDDLNILYDDSSSVAAINTYGVEHFFVNIVVVSKSDIPANINSDYIYKK